MQQEPGALDLWMDEKTEQYWQNMLAHHGGEDISLDRLLQAFEFEDTLSDALLKQIARHILRLHDKNAMAAMKKILKQGPRLSKLKQHPQRVLRPLLLFQQLQVPPDPTHQAPDSETTVRVADIINDGLTAPALGSQVEALKFIRSVAVHVAHPTTLRLAEAIEGCEEDFVSSDVKAFGIATLHEIIFLRQDLMSDLPMNHPIMESIFRWMMHEDIAVRRAAIVSSIRLLLYDERIWEHSAPMLSRLVDIHVIGSETGPIRRCLQSFFTVQYGKHASHHQLLQTVILTTTREAYLFGVPLPPYEAIRQDTTVAERRLYEKTRLLARLLPTTCAKQLYHDFRLMAMVEFGINYTSQRVAEILAKVCLDSSELETYINVKS